MKDGIRDGDPGVAGSLSILSLVPRWFVAVDDTLVGTCLVAPRAWEVRKTLDDDKALAAAL